ncbi:hypothetical protein [Cyanobium sp. NIES-981]|nr:hypothetical protein [Cyanobium sp. NIES-981]
MAIAVQSVPAAGATNAPQLLHVHYGSLGVLMLKRRWTQPGSP